MNNTTFTKNVVEPTINQIQIVLGKKAFEYTPENDRFHNFRQAGLMQNITPEQALWGMNAKHIISIQDIVKDTAEEIVPTKEMIDEKINDAINYLILLKGLLYARYELNEAVLTDIKNRVASTKPTLSQETINTIHSIIMTGLAEVQFQSGVESLEEAQEEFTKVFGKYKED